MTVFVANFPAVSENLFPKATAKIFAPAFKKFWVLVIAKLMIFAILFLRDAIEAKLTTKNLPLAVRNTLKASAETAVTDLTNRRPGFGFTASATATDKFFAKLLIYKSGLLILTSDVENHVLRCGI
jgi:hypothetical protein